MGLAAGTFYSVRQLNAGLLFFILPGGPIPAAQFVLDISGGGIAVNSPGRVSLYVKTLLLKRQLEQTNAWNTVQRRAHFQIRRASCRDTRETSGKAALVGY